MEIKYTARAEYFNGRESDFNGYSWRSFTAEIHRIYKGR